MKTCVRVNYLGVSSTCCTVSSLHNFSKWSFG